MVGPGEELYTVLCVLFNIEEDDTRMSSEGQMYYFVTVESCVQYKLKNKKKLCQQNDQTE